MVLQDIYEQGRNSVPIYLYHLFSIKQPLENSCHYNNVYKMYLQPSGHTTKADVQCKRNNKRLLREKTTKPGSQGVRPARACKMKISRMKPSAALINIIKHLGARPWGACVVCDANLAAIPTWRSPWVAQSWCLPCQVFWPLRQLCGCIPQ